MSNNPTVVNKNCYAPLGKTTPHQKITLRVDAILDMFPGAWHQPEDLMNHIAQHSYVQAVTLEAMPTDKHIAKVVNYGDVIIGDVAAEMHLHEAGFGIFQGWDVHNRFEISKEMFEAMTASVPAIDAITQNLKVVGNKFARIISINEGYDDNVASVLVVYQYDLGYHIATLVTPKN